MYMKVFSHGKGRGESATEYLLNSDFHNREDNPPSLLRGDPELVADLINSLDTAWKYTSGVLSWHPDDKVTPEKEIELMNDFEALAFAGLEEDQYNILWVRHSHANHHELHFVIPRVELHTGKAFNPCPPKWQKHFDPLRDYYNIKENWARPDDPERARTHTPASADIIHNRLKRLGKTKSKSETDKARELLINYAIQGVESGKIKNRADILSSFQKLGLEINRKGKDYITIQNKEDNTKIRLKGGIFNEDWRLEKENAREFANGQGDTRDEHARELERLRNEVENITTKRAEYNRSRYAKTISPSEIAQTNELEKLALQSDTELFSNLWGIPRNGANNEVLQQENRELSRADNIARERREETPSSIAEPDNLWNRDTEGWRKSLPYTSTKLENRNRHNNSSGEEIQCNSAEEVKEEVHDRNTKSHKNSISTHGRGADKSLEQTRKGTFRSLFEAGEALIRNRKRPSRQAITGLFKDTNPNTDFTKSANKLESILTEFNRTLQHISDYVQKLTRRLEKNLGRTNTKNISKGLGR